MRKKRSLPTLILGLLVIVIFIVGIFVFVQGDKLSLSGNAQKSSTDSSSLVSSESSTSSTASATDLPDVSSSDWELVLVNRDNITAEMNPDLTQIDNIYVDSRITDNVRNFWQQRKLLIAVNI